MKFSDVPFFFFKHQRKDIVLTSGLVIVDGLLGLIGISLLMPMLTPSAVEGTPMSGIFNSVIEFLSGFELLPPSGFLALIFLLRLVFTSFIAKYTTKRANRSTLQYQAQIIARILKTKTSNAQRFTTGEIMNCLTTESETLSVAYSLTTQLLQNLVLSGMYLSLAVFINTKGSVFTILCGGFLLVLFKSLNKWTSQWSYSLVSFNKLNKNLFHQIIENRDYIHATHKQDSWNLQIRNNLLEAIKRKDLLDFSGKLVKKLPEPLGAFIIATLVLTNTYFDFIDPLNLVLMAVFIYKALNAILSSMYTNQRLYALSGSISNIQEFLNQLTEEPPGDEEISQITEIELKGLKVLGTNNLELNMKLQAGRVYSFVGKTGIGKSTLLKTLTGISTPHSGSISVNGISLDQINFESYRSQIGFLTQNPQVFNGTVKENLVQDNAIDDEELIQILKSLSLDELASKDGLSLAIRESGKNLSGGQAQRLVLARELLKDPKLLILDEATSALDLKTEKKVIEEINRRKKSFICVSISHKPQFLEIADEVIELN